MIVTNESGPQIEEPNLLFSDHFKANMKQSIIPICLDVAFIGVSAWICSKAAMRNHLPALINGVALLVLSTIHIGIISVLSLREKDPSRFKKMSEESSKVIGNIGLVTFLLTLVLLGRR